MRGAAARSSKRSSLSLNIFILALLTFERVGELWLSRRNTRHLLARGAFEVAPGHYLLIILVHTAWLGVLWWLAPYRPISLFWLALFVLIEMARIWVMLSLRERWTTRIIVLPDAPLVRSGPYRFVNHPNYVVVAAEIAVMPLVFGLWRVALIFTVLNAAVLTVRIGAENRALHSLRG